MANKISLNFEAPGAEAAAAKIDKVTASVAGLNAKLTGMNLGGKGDLSGFPAHILAQIAAQPGGAAGGGGSGPIKGTGAPPIIPGLGGGGRLNFGGLALGAVAGMFSPFAGARMMAQAMGGRGGGGGGGGGSIAQGIFGPGGVSAFSLDFVLLKTATQLLRFEFDHLKQAFERGAKLFTDASVAGRTPGQLFALQAAGRAIGLSPDQITKLATQQNLFSKGRSVNAGGELLRAAHGLGDSESGTRLLQNQTLFAQTYQDFKQFQDAIDESSRSLYEFKTIIGQLGDIISGTLIIAMGDLARVVNLFGITLEQGIVGLAKIFAKGAEAAIGKLFGGAVGELFPKLVGLLPNVLPNPGNERLLASGGGSRPESGWEKMGLIIQGGIGNAEYAKQTAENTKRMADAIAGGKNAGIVPYGMTAGSMFHLP